MSGKFLSKKGKAKGNALRFVLELIFLLAALGLTAWVCLYVHPADPISTGRGSSAKADLSAPMTRFSADTASLALSQVADVPEEITVVVVPEEPEPEEVKYRIEDGALCGMTPNPACYGSSKDPADVEAVIARAAELLEGDGVAWNRDLPFWDAMEFNWYLDETIFVLTWTELDRGIIRYCSEVKVADASQFRRMLAGNTYGAVQQLRCTKLAAAANAVLACNADYYMFRLTGTNVYEGTLYRCVPGLDDCYIDSNGDLLLVHAKTMETEEEVLDFIEKNDINFSLSFGPILVEDGVAVASNRYPIGQGFSVSARSAIGQMGARHYLMMNINYTDLETAAMLMAEKPVIKAYALDGGQTGETVFGGKVFNRIVYDSERNVSDIIYFATAYPWEVAEE